MSLALGIVVVAAAVISLVAVFAIFFWAAVKDGQDEAASQARMRQPQMRQPQLVRSLAQRRRPGRRIR